MSIKVKGKKLFIGGQYVADLTDMSIAIDGEEIQLKDVRIINDNVTAYEFKEPVQCTEGTEVKTTITGRIFDAERG